MDKEFLKCYEYMKNLYAELQKSAYLNHFTLRLVSQKHWENVSDEDASKFLLLLQQIQELLGENFKISELDYLFPQNFSSIMKYKLQLDNLNVNLSKLRLSSISMQIVSNFICSEKLHISLFNGRQIHKYEEKIQSPSILKIIFYHEGGYVDRLDWEYTVVNILDSIIPSSNLIELDISLVRFMFKVYDLNNLVQIYKFIEQCPSLKKLHLPFTNDSTLLQSFTTLIKNIGSNLQYLQLKYAKHVINNNQTQVHPVLFELFGYISTNMSNLRYLKLELPDEGFKLYEEGYIEHFRSRTLPLHVKFRRYYNPQTSTYYYMSTQNQKYNI
ncbi:hypothetical protein FGO68_gene7749 [Halteria grandinella]|uniref:Uncharacterized protein n=1 Tax=Halteria grandinella TaxID=5974 RepID=A0A8J8T6S8_HALGN|nr:hypothetical protein FGO68_gene7749 [Halteria grandinella]